MRRARLSAAGWVGHALMLAAVLPLAARASSDGLDVTVVDRDGRPIPEVAVYAVPADGAVNTPAADLVATMDQRGLAFVPHILIVQTGTLVEFPNSDDVLHHVYSFSPAKRFELPLYAGSVHAPLKFDMSGLVTLGCNIHDDMLGYILVVDTPYFDSTEGTGTVHLEGLPHGDYFVHIWTPRQRPDRLPEPVRVQVGAGGQSVSFQIVDKLYPPHEHSQTSLLWSNY